MVDCVFVSGLVSLPLARLLPLLLGTPRPPGQTEGPLVFLLLAAQTQASQLMGKAAGAARLR